jgi:hypothetical protein
LILIGRRYTQRGRAANQRNHPLPPRGHKR